MRTVAVISTRRSIVLVGPGDRVVVVDRICSVALPLKATPGGIMPVRSGAERGRWDAKSQRGLRLVREKRAAVTGVQPY